MVGGTHSFTIWPVSPPSTSSSPAPSPSLLTATRPDVQLQPRTSPPFLSRPLLTAPPPRRPPPIQAGQQDPRPQAAPPAPAPGACGDRAHSTPRASACSGRLQPCTPKLTPHPPSILLTHVHISPRLHRPQAGATSHLARRPPPGAEEEKSSPDGQREGWWGRAGVSMTSQGTSTRGGRSDHDVGTKTSHLGTPSEHRQAGALAKLPLNALLQKPLSGHRDRPPPRPPAWSGPDLTPSRWAAWGWILAAVQGSASFSDGTVR